MIKNIKWIYLTYSIAWICISVAICFSIYCTGKLWGLLAFMVIKMPNISTSEKED